MKTLITGGAGFIGSEVTRLLVDTPAMEVINLDALTYAGNQAAVKSVAHRDNYHFARIDVRDGRAVSALLEDTRPDAIIHLAAESHVDRSIDGPSIFIDTNVIGTYVLLEAARAYWTSLSPTRQNAFRFLHVSTDEVFGELGPHDAPFNETTAYHPNSPYSASKAASDHLVRAWERTYGLPTIVSNCSNNYGPYQNPEKFIPLMIINALERRPLPIYGDGHNIRDWLHVEDHARALIRILLQGEVGETYVIGGGEERSNNDVAHAICTLVDELAPGAPQEAGGRAQLIRHVKDRPGHDGRYAVDASKITRELGWRAQESFDSGLRKTVHWYLQNPTWWRESRPKDVPETTDAIEATSATAPMKEAVE